MFLPSPCASWSRCGAPQLPDALGWAGEALGVFTAWHRRSRPPGIAKHGFPTLYDSEASCVSQEFASGLAFFLLPPPASGAGTGGSRLRQEPPLGSGGRPRPGRLAHPGLAAHGASSAVDLPSPPQRPMLDVGFSFPFGAVRDWVFFPSASPSMVSAGLAGTGHFCSLSLFGEAVPRRLTFALLPHFMLCSCLAVAFSFPDLCRARGSSASSCLPIPGHRAVPGPGAPGPRWGCGRG